MLSAGRIWGAVNGVCVCVPMHGPQLGGNATETGGDSVDLHLFDGIGLLTVRQVVGPQKAERHGGLQQQNKKPERKGHRDRVGRHLYRKKGL